MDTTTKTCSKCGEVKPVEEFDGPKRSYCKSCRRAQRKVHYAKNREKILAQQKQYLEANPEKKQKAVLRVKEWRKENPDKDKILRKQYREKHKQKRSEYEKQRRAEESVKAHLKNQAKGYTKTLTDGAVRKMITAHQSTLKASDIPQHIVDLKREHVTTYRVVKRLIEALKEKQND